MTLTSFSQMVLPSLEADIQKVVATSTIGNDQSLTDILAYHFGWNIKGSQPGKRIRPLLLLLATESCGESWQEAIPAASAIELLHNFSLIHDDIEDKSDTRRGRRTAWKEYTLPLALNAGDSMYSLAYISMERLSQFKSEETTLQSLRIFSQTCLNLTKGQHLDISFEDQDQVSIAQYWQMIQGKTAALIASCTQLGAVIAESDPTTQEAYRQFGLNLGLAFQVHDDLLGIWGDPEVTGKSAASDLLTRKKSLPILFGLEQNQDFAALWRKEITPDNVKQLAATLREEGAFDYTQKQAALLTEKARNYFQETGAQGEAAAVLEELMNLLIKRKH